MVYKRYYNSKKPTYKAGKIVMFQPFPPFNIVHTMIIKHDLTMNQEWVKQKRGSKYNFKLDSL